MRLPQLPTASSAAATLLAGLLASSSVLPCQLPPPASAAALDASTVQLALRYSELETRDPEQSFTSRLPQIEWGNVAAQFTDTAAKAESAAESAAAKAAEFANNPATKAKAAEFAGVAESAAAKAAEFANSPAT